MARRILELAKIRRTMQKERVFRDRRNPLDIFDDAELVKRCRFSMEGDYGDHGHCCSGH